ncbi:MAG TPA: hypothetical protein VF523_05455, partial [Burkholderiales bacterium]
LRQPASQDSVSMLLTFIFYPSGLQIKGVDTEVTEEKQEMGQRKLEFSLPIQVCQEYVHGNLRPRP